ncbi:Nitrilase 1, partial [Tetrabaena socialis]
MQTPRSSEPRLGCAPQEEAAAATQPPPLTRPPDQEAPAPAAGGGGAPANVRIAVGQMTSTGDTSANFDTCARLAQDAVQAGCRMIFLPECFSFIGESPSETLAAAQPLDGPLMTRYRDLARSLGLWLSLGGFQEVGPDPTHIFNTHVVVDDTGALVARYRKIHLFDVDVPNGPVLLESRTTAPGTEAVVVDTPAGPLGMTTCYDLRFPELYAQLTWERGAQILAIPSAFTVITGQAHWEVLLRARAIECQAYVVAAAQAGRHNGKRESYGHALIVDPWGTVVAALPDPHATGIAVAEVDAALLARVRERMPCRLHRLRGREAYAPGPD